MVYYFIEIKSIECMVLSGDYFYCNSELILWDSLFLRVEILGRINFFAGFVIKKRYLN